MMYIVTRNRVLEDDVTAMYYRDSDIWRTARNLCPSPLPAAAVDDDALAVRIPGCRVRNKVTNQIGYLVLVDNDRAEGYLVRSEIEGSWVWQGSEVEYIDLWYRD